MNKIELKKNLYILGQLIRRSMKIFLKDRLAVFFSLLAPLIILMLYILFLGSVQYESIISSIPKEMDLSKDSIMAFLDSWMIAGTLSVACITVSFNANSVMVKDKARNNINDMLSSPIKRWVITLSYFLYNFIVTIVICFVVFIVSLLFLLINSHFYMSVSDIFITLGILFLSCSLATVMTVFIAGFIKSESALGGIGGIISAAIGFLIGAYMPTSVFPKPVQYVIGFIPNSYSSGLFRNFIMRGALDNLTKTMPLELADELQVAFSMKMELFNQNISIGIMIAIIAVAFCLFTVLNLLFTLRKKH